MTGAARGSRRVREFSSVPSLGAFWFVGDLKSAFDSECHIFTRLHPAAPLLSQSHSTFCGAMVEKRKMNSAPGKPGKPLKITAVGDGMVGKTCLLITYTTKTFPTKYVPTVFDNFADSLTVDGQEYNTTLWDTAGQEDYERLRPLSYTHTDCFLLCFSVNNRTSYDNIQSKWCPELKHHCPNVPIILVGTKSDLRNEPSADCLTPSDGRKLRRKIKAIKYMECSAINQENLTEIFVEAVRACVKTKVDANCICC